MGFQRWENRKRHRAASRIQRAFRRRRFTRRVNRRATYRRHAGFARKVNRAVTARDPCQYAIGGTDGLTLTINPQIIATYSRIPYTQDAGTNVKFLRTSQKVFAKNLSVTIKLKLPQGATSDIHNSICLAFVRFKRSSEMRNADIQDPGITQGPLTTSDDKPFLPCQRNTAPYFMSLPLNMTTTAVGSANPFMLQTMWNPKVVDVLKKWNITLQQQHTTGYPVTYPFQKDFTFNYKFNETWKYSNDAPPAVDPSQTEAPYNNKNYYLIGWSDSSVAGHPYLTTSSRLSFKDID